MKEWVVKTHIGDFRTVAPTAKKAIANIRFRLFGRGCGVSTAYWEAKEVE